MDGAITALITTLGNLAALYAVEVAPAASGASFLGQWATIIFAVVTLAIAIAAYMNGEITSNALASTFISTVISVSVNMAFSYFAFAGTTVTTVVVAAGGPLFLMMMIFVSMTIDYILNELLKLYVILGSSISRRPYV